MRWLELDRPKLAHELSGDSQYRDPRNTMKKKEPPYLKKMCRTYSAYSELIHVNSSTLEKSPRGVQALGLLVRIWAYLMLALLAIVIWLSGFLGKRKASVSKLTVECEV